MKKSIFFIFIALFALTACNREKVIVEETYTFSNDNWNHEDRIITYHAKIDASPNPHKILVELEHAHGEMPALPITLTIKSPDGGTTTRRVHLPFGNEHQENPNVAVVEIYPEKYFNASGEYEFAVLRKWEKYDFYGNKALTLKVIKLPVD